MAQSFLRDPAASVVEEMQLAMDHHYSAVDLIFIDFYKAFDTVPHQRLL